jgi:hypothetical protein
MKRIRSPRHPVSFDPEATPILVEAFDAAWHDLYTAGCEAAVGPEAEAVRERLARRIVEQARRGVRDPIDLSSDGVAHILAAAANATSRRGGAFDGG